MSFIYDMIDTWNSGATTFSAIKMNVTDTASAAGSLLLDLQIGGVAKITGTKAGALRVADGTAAAPAYSFGSDPDTGFFSSGAGQIGGSIDGVQRFRWTANDFRIESNSAAVWMGEAGDLQLYRDAPNTLAQRNGTAAQADRLYNTFTDASNYERLTQRWTANELHIETDQAGTGASRILVIGTSGVNTMYLKTGGTNRWGVDSSTGSLFPVANGTYDIGFAGSAVRKLFLDYTNTATVGAVTINKAAGRVNIAAAGTSVVVTNSLVTAASHVIAVVSQADATAYIRNVVPAAGSFTITLGAAATAQVSIDFFVVSAD